MRDLFSDLPEAADHLPIPPLRLRRIHLRGVGPDGARFDPLDLDFSTREGAASRVMLSLTNTGGKSTLIALVSSLVVPASRAQVGGKNLGDYVLTGDTSHILCEWEDAATQTRTVIATVMEWKEGRRQPGHKQRSTINMHRAWYLFRTGPSLPSIDDLPFVVDGRRTTFEAFLSGVADLMSLHPQAQWVQTRVQQDWTRTLEQRTSIDPVLFSYQMRMNDAEAGAEKLLATFDSPDNVVRFFVGALNNDREIADYTAKLAPYAELAAQRPHLHALATFGEQLAPAIELIAVRNNTLRAKASAALRTRVAGGELLTMLQQRITNDQALLSDLEIKLAAASAEVATVRRDYGQISDIRLQLQMEAARARLAAAEVAVERARHAAELSAFEARAWVAVDAVVDVGRARETRDATQAAYEAAEQGLEPLRVRVAQAASALAGRLDALIGEAASAVSEAEAAAEAAGREQEAALDEEKAQQRRLDDAVRRLKEIDAYLQQAEAAEWLAVEAGWLHSGEPAHVCRQRWHGAAKRARVEAETATGAAGNAETAFDVANEEAEQIDVRLVELRAAADRLATAATTFDRDLTAIVADNTTLALVATVPRDVPDVARLAEIAERAASEADLRAADHERVAELAATDLAHLDETGTAPAGPDVLAVLAALIDARIGAVSGLEWVERNITEPSARSEFIRYNADIAGGVIVSDPNRFGTAVDVLTAASLHTRTPVTITTAPDDRTAAPAHADGRYTVLPHRSTWDRQWAMDYRQQLQTQAATRGDAARRARSTASQYRTTAVVCVRFIEQWQATTRPELQERAAAAAAEVTDGHRQRDNLRRFAAEQREAAAQHRDQAIAARDQAAIANEHVQRADDLLKIKNEEAAAIRERPAVETARTTADALRQQAERRRSAAGTEIRLRTNAAASARAARQEFARERREVPIDVAGPDPGGNLEVVRGAWSRLSTELSAAERGMVEAEHLHRAQQALAEALDRMDRFDQQEIERAQQLAGTIVASSRESLQDAQHRADHVAQECRLARMRAEHEHEQAAQVVRDAAPPSGDRQNHIDLASIPEWRPATPVDIPDLLVRLEARNGELLARLNTATAEEAENTQLRDAITSDIIGFGDIVEVWQSEPIPTTQAYSGSRDAARSEMRTLIKQNRDAEKEERAATADLSEAIHRARAAAIEPRWKDLDTPAAVRVRFLTDADLVAEAPVLAQRLRALAESAGGDLRDLDTHRSILRDGLIAICREQRRLLREVSRASRLPDGLGELSGNAAIKIHFDDAPDNETAVRLAERVDAWAVELADNPKRATSADVRTRWLADAVRDSVVDRPRAGAWTIDILKPRIDGKVAYCPPDRIPQEFSGGQVLTLAVLVYCALSGVRSAHRPGGARPPGTLILDNPFGTASAEALIAMQHRLAARTGLQLVCATGLHDAGVDAAFSGAGSVIVKLRNDGDVRRNLSFLRLRSRVVDGIDVAAGLTAGRDPSSPQNWVDATTYEIHT